jgi:hypothetical protein
MIGCVIMITSPPLLLFRRPRQVGVDWTRARSWLGGVPWPRSADGLPLHHVAQIDLAEIAAKTRATGLPETGSLAFFIGPPGAVLYVPDHMSHEHTPPPEDTPDMSMHDLLWIQNLKGYPLFPFWPLDFMPLNVPYTPEEDAGDSGYSPHTQLVEMKKHFTLRDCDLSPGEAFFGEPIPDWWRTAIYYTDVLALAVKNSQNVLKNTQNNLERWRKKVAEERARDGGETPALKDAEKYVTMYNNLIAAQERLHPAFIEFTEEAIEWTKGWEPWSLMIADDIGHLVSLLGNCSPLRAPPACLRLCACELRSLTM